MLGEIPAAERGYDGSLGAGVADAWGAGVAVVGARGLGAVCGVAGRGLGRWGRRLVLCSARYPRRSAGMTDPGAWVWRILGARV